MNAMGRSRTSGFNAFQLKARKCAPRSNALNPLVRLRPIAFIAVLLVGWQVAVSLSAVHILPGPSEVVGGIVDLVRHGLLLKYMVASLFRVTWGFVLAAVLAIPIGLTVG